MQAVLEEQASLELGAVDTNNILTLLECPVCLDHITPPIKQCIKGHLVCSDCFPRLPHCPTCRSVMSPERNLGMEQVSRLLNFPCRYHPMGCKVAATLTKKAEHERNCQYLQLKCPFHGQCSFCGPLTMVVPHLKSDHQVTPVPVQPSGVLFYRAKHFFKRNLWAFIYEWDKNLFRLMVKHIHASNVGRSENGNLLIAHIQYIGPDSMASQYAYQISLFDAEKKKSGPKFEGVVSSTLKALESQVSKEEVFVANTYTARDYTDQFANLNFIIKMRSLKDKEESTPTSTSSSRNATSTPASTPAARPPPVEAAPAAPASTSAESNNNHSAGLVAAAPVPQSSQPSTASSSSSSSSSSPPTQGTDAMEEVIGGGELLTAGSPQPGPSSAP